jgi:GxxExxY protein
MVSAILDGAGDVHNALGPGLMEKVYSDAMAIELAHRGLKFEREKPVTLTYRGKPLRTHRLDMVVENEVLLELKSVERLMPIHRSQVLGYLRGSELRLGLLINFNAYMLKDQIKRVVL